MFLEILSLLWVKQPWKPWTLFWIHGSQSLFVAHSDAYHLVLDRDDIHS